MDFFSVDLSNWLFAASETFIPDHGRVTGVQPGSSFCSCFRCQNKKPLLVLGLAPSGLSCGGAGMPSRCTGVHLSPYPFHCTGISSCKSKINICMDPAINCIHREREVAKELASDLKIPGLVPSSCGTMVKSLLDVHQPWDVWLLPLGTPSVGLADAETSSLLTLGKEKLLS